MGDIINVIIFIVVVLFSVLGQFIKEKPPGRRQPARRVPPPDPAAQPNRNALEGEIEDFLRRAIGWDQPAEAEVVEPEIEEAEPAIRTLTNTQTDSIRAGESVASHVQQHRLGETIDHSDERLEGHLHDVFEHRLGSLASEKSTFQISEGTDANAWDYESTQTASYITGQDIRNLFQSPDDIRKIIVANEILRRPTDRWQ
ncbi:MAG: hypothetical protein R3C28_20505 [Pirellulaceae bacterium]